ncbi:MAG: FAD-dependent oxidoreductase [Bacteroidales bacterium]|nr:FAD-dependent oxidoreductase [Bacteroidales bacterium]
MKIIIIGAGPAGLSCAFHLAKHGHNVEVYEASNLIGGMARSFDLWNQRVDLGPHRFFSKQKEVNDFFIELIKDDYTLVKRQTRIFYNNRYFDYPLKLGNVLKNLPFVTVIGILWHYFLQRLKPIKEPKNFEEWVTNRFGKKLFELFFKNYTEKLWGIKCSQIDADWAAQRIKNLSLFEAVKTAIVGNRGNKHKTLIDEFAYPNHGTGTIYERAVDYIHANGGNVFLNKPIKRVLLDENNTTAKGIELIDGTICYADSVVSTMPLTLLVKGLQAVPDAVSDAISKLYFRNTILVYLEINQEFLFTDNWLYIHSPNVKHGRVTNFRNWSPHLNKDQKSTILCMEFWCFENDEIWNGDENNISKTAQEEIYKINLIPPSAQILNTKIIKIPKCYPVYETGYQSNLNEIVTYLKTIKSLYPIGRYGAFKYNNQDHSILMGILAANNIMGKTETDLWLINTDTEYHEKGKSMNKNDTLR